MSEQRTNFIGRIQEQRQFQLALHGLADHHRRWLEALALNPANGGPEDDSYTRIFLPHGIGGIGKSWLTRRCIQLANEANLTPPVLTVYDDVSVGTPVLTPTDLLERLYRHLLQAGYKTVTANYRDLQTQAARLTDRVIRYRAENQTLWQNLLKQAADFSEAADIDPAAGANELLLNHMQKAGLLSPNQVNLLLYPAETLAVALVAAIANIVAERPLVIALDNLEIVTALEPFIRDRLVLPTVHLPVLWILSGRHNLADERIVEIDGQERVHKGYRDLLGQNPPLEWDMDTFGDADLRSYLEKEAARRYEQLEIDDQLIAAIKATSSGVPLVVEMAVDALFTLDRTEFLQNFALDDKTLLPAGRLEQVTTRFLRACLTNPADMERVQALALLRRNPGEDALKAVWNVDSGQDVADSLRGLINRYAFVKDDGLHDAVYEFVRRQLHALPPDDPVRSRLAGRAVAFYQARWQNPGETNPTDVEATDPARLINQPDWQDTTRHLLNALLWLDMDEALRFFLPRFVEGLAFNRPWAAELLHQLDDFLARDKSAPEAEYLALLPVLQTGLQEMALYLDEPGPAVAQMVNTLLPVPVWEALHLTILHLWTGLRLVAQSAGDEALAALMTVREYLPPHAATLAEQLGQAFKRLARGFLWPNQAVEPVPSEAGLQAARQATELLPQNGAAWYNLGIALEYLDRANEAISAYETAVELSPRSTYYSSLGDALSASNDYEPALDAYHQAIELDADLPWAYHGLAVVYSELGRYEAAITAFHQAIERHSNDKDWAVALDGLGDVYVALGRHTEALAAFRQAVKLNPHDALPWYSLGNVYSALGRYEEAQEPYRRAIDLAPDYAWAYHNLALVHQQRGEYTPALELYRQAIEYHDNDDDRALAWNSLGDVYAALNQPQNAIDAYHQAVNLDDKLAAPWDGLARIYNQLGRFQSAVKAYRQLLALSPGDATAWYSLGNALSAGNDYEPAIKAYRRAIDLAPDNGWAYNNLAFVYQKLGQLPQAVELYRQAIDCHTNEHDKAVSWDNLGEAYAGQQNFDEAISAYRWAMSLDPAYPWPYHNLGEVYLARGEFEQAITHLQQAIERHQQDEDRAASWRVLGEACQAAGRLEEAISAYQRVIELTPHNAASSWFRLGQVYQNMEAGGTTPIIEAYRRAIELAPDFAWAYHNLGLIYEQKQEYSEALRLFRQAIQHHTSNADRAESWLKMGDVYLAQNRLSPADDAYRQVIDLNPASPWPWHRLGLINLQHRQKYEPAVKLFQQAAARHTDPHHKARALNYLGDAQWALSRHKEAIDAYRQAIELDENFAQPWNSVGDVLRLLGQPDEAINAYRRTIELAPDLAWPYHSLGLIYSHRGETDRTAYEAAITLYRQAIERHKNDRDRARAWNNLGSTYQALGRSSEAIKSFRQAIELDPAYTLPWHNLGGVYQALHYPEDALEAYRQAIDLDPKDAVAWNSLGDVYRSQQHFEPAIEAYNQAISIKTSYAQPYFSLGLIYEAQSEYSSAIPMFKQAARHYEHDEDRAAAWHRLGHIYRAQNRLDDARTAWRQAVEFDPAFAWPWHQLARLAETEEDYDTAIGLYRQAIECHVNDRDRVVSWQRLGDVCHTLNRPEEAIEAYQHVLELAPHDAQAWNSLGTAHTALEHFELAIKAFEKAVELAPDYAWPYHNLGYVYEKREEYARAIPYYRQAIDRHQHEADAAVSWNNLGNAHTALKQYDDAVTAYRKSIDLKPDYALPWDSLGDVYRLLNRPEEAIQAYQRAIELDPAYAWPYHNLALVYAGQQTYDKALALYQDAINRHGNNQDRAVTWNNLGKVYFALGRDPEAIKAYGKAIELDPAYSWSYNNLGVVYARQGSYDTAINLYRDAIDHHTTNAGKAVSWDNLGKVLASTGRYDDAMNAYRQAIALDDTYALPWYNLGHLYRGLERFTEAVDAYRQAIHRNQTFAPAWQGLGDALRGLAEPAGDAALEDEAITAYRRAIELDESHPWPYHSLGTIYEARQAYQEALTCYRQAQTRYERNSQKAVIWFHIGNVQRALNQPQPAIEAYRQATDLDPAYALPWHRLGNLFDELGQYQEAIAAYRRAIELDSGPAWPYHHLGLVYEKLQDYDAAESLYRQAIARHQTDPDRAVAWNHLGGIYHRWGHYQQAIAAFRQAIQLDSSYALPWNGLGAVYQELRQPEETVKAYRRAIELDPTDARPYNNLGFFYEQTGQYEQAITLYRQVINQHQQDSDRAVSWNNLGNVYRATGQLDKATEAYRQAIKLDPDYSWPYQNLAAIYEEQGKYDAALSLYQQATRQFQMAA